MSASLFYFGTDTPVCLGDRFFFRKLFKNAAGNVVYVPGQSDLNKAFGDDTWAVQLDDEPGDIRSMPYFPNYEKYAPKKIIFIERQCDANVVRQDESIL